jgi:hypothetical protein
LASSRPLRNNFKSAHDQKLHGFIERVGLANRRLSLAQTLGPNGPIDRVTEIREYDPVVDFTTVTATFRVDSDEGITIL